MPEEEQDVDTLLLRAVADGQARCRNEQISAAALLTPAPPQWDSARNHMLQQQITRFGSLEEVLRHYLELLSRVQMFVDFCRENVGVTDDWPLNILAESEHAADLWEAHHRRVADITEVLVEV